MVILFLFLIFCALPVFEIYLFWQVGGFLGFWNTFGLVILTAFVGAIFLKREFEEVLRAMHVRLAREEIPSRELVESILLFFGGVLLVVPGFFTDFLGFLCLLPPVRQFVAILVVEGILGGVLDAVGVVHWAAEKASANPTKKAKPTPPEVIDVDFSVEKEER